MKEPTVDANDKCTCSSTQHKNNFIYKRHMQFLTSPPNFSRGGVSWTLWPRLPEPLVLSGFVHRKMIDFVPARFQLALNSAEVRKDKRSRLRSFKNSLLNAVHAHHAIQALRFYRRVNNCHPLILQFYQKTDLHPKTFLAYSLNQRNCNVYLHQRPTLRVHVMGLPCPSKKSRTSTTL